MRSESRNHIALTNKDETIQLFINPNLERLTHVHPCSPFLFFIPIMLVFSYLAIIHLTLLKFILGFFVGLFLWSFMEYIMHRYIFHYSYRVSEKFFFLMHGVHHASPRDSTRLVMSPIISLLAASVIYSIYHFIFNTYYEAIFAGTACGYMIYDLTHYAIHKYNFKNSVFQYLKRYHFSHHYYDSEKGYGVSSPLWDYIFQTKAVFLKNADKSEKK